MDTSDPSNYVEQNPDGSAISGNASASDYDLLSGGYLAYAQNPYSAADDGTLTNTNLSTGSTGSAPATSAPAAGTGSSYTPPSFWNQLTTFVQGASTAAGNINTAVKPLINGTPVAGPAVAGQGNKNITSALGLNNLTSNPTLLLAIVAVVLFLVLRKR